MRPGTRRAGLSAARLRSTHLVALRRAAGLTQSELAALIGSPSRELRVGEWERGEAQPHPRYLARLAAALDVDPVQLLDVDPDDPPLVALRLAAGLTLQAAAAAAGLSLSAYTRLEKGVVRSGPEPAAAQRLATALGISTERLAQSLAHSRRVRQIP